MFILIACLPVFLFCLCDFSRNKLRICLFVSSGLSVCLAISIYLSI